MFIVDIYTKHVDIYYCICIGRGVGKINNEILDICSELFDRITLIKGYLTLGIEQKKIDYSLILLQEIDEIDILVRKIVDIVKQ